jgi:glutathione peroxidase
VIGFPSNDFNQELATDKEVKDFCKLTYAVEFPMTTKSNVTGKNANPFYQELIKATGEMPKWNFHKYLILPQGKKVYAFTSDVTPDSPDIIDKIKAELK